MKRLAHGLFLPVVCLLLWYMVTALQLFNPYLLPTPAVVGHAFVELWENGELVRNILVSLGRVLFGFLFSCLIALPLGIVCGRSSFFKNFCWTILEFFRHVPPLAAIPLIILWFGIGEESKLVIIIWASFFPLFLNTLSGIRGCDTRLLEVGASLHFSSWERLKHIELPAALPAILVGLRLSLGYSWRALIGAELIAASSGIGYMILDAQQLSRPDIVLVGVFCIGIIGTLIDELFLLLTVAVVPWQRKAGLL